MGYSIFDETMVDLTWPEIEEAIRQKAVVILPVGVIEEHGPHLGLAVDIYVSYQLAKLTRRRLENNGIRTLIAPPYYWGINNLTRAFPGSFTVHPETMQAVLFDILASLQAWGVNYVFTLNWHGEYAHNQALLEAVKAARRETGIQAYAILSDAEAKIFKLSGQEDYVAIQQSPSPVPRTSPYADIHSGSMETAIMLEYFAEQVKTGIINSLKPTKITFADLKELRAGGDEVRKRIPQGYFGNPAGCNLEKAQKEMEDIAGRCAELIQSIVRK